MKGYEVRQLMKTGILHVWYQDEECVVLHKFKHKSWINYKGKIYSVKHKDLIFSRVIADQSTLRSHGGSLSTPAKAKETLSNLHKYYREDIDRFGKLPLPRDYRQIGLKSTKLAEKIIKDALNF